MLRSLLSSPVLSFLVVCAENDHDCEKAGWLKMKSTMLNIFKRRFFFKLESDSSSLSFFESAHQTFPTGFIPFNQITKVSASEKSALKFSVVLGNNCVYKFTCPNEEVMKDWVVVLSEVEKAPVSSDQVHDRS